MIRNPNVGDRVTIPGWPTRQAGTITEIRKASSRRGLTRIVVTTDAGATRILDTVELDAEALPERPRRKSAGYRR